jgi:CheY-like chemotaxis protein
MRGSTGVTVMSVEGLRAAAKSQPASSHPEALAERTGTAGTKDHQPLSILIVEDDLADLFWMTNALTNMDELKVSITHAPLVSRAIELLNEKEFDLAFIDHYLPDGRGEQVLAALKYGSSRCAVVAMSGRSMSDVSSYALSGGAVAALAKDDMNTGLLQTTIQFALHNHAIRNGLASVLGPESG